MPDKARYIWLFFSSRGRIGRAVYFLANLLIMVLQFYPIYRATLELVELGPENLIGMSMEQIAMLSPEFERWSSIFSFLVLVMLWPCVALAIKRLHDLGRAGILAVTLFIPFLNVLVFAALCVVPGRDQPNAYGRNRDRPE